METPLQLEIEGFRPSAHLRDLIDTNISRLERRYGRITACRAAIRAPNAHHKMGEPYFVSIWLALPNKREVSVKPTPRGVDRRQGDVTFAVNDAFRRADRQLRDHASQMKGRVKAHAEQPKGKVVRMDRSGKFGFIEAEDGREIYFNINSLIDGAKLKPGTRVSFHEEEGEKGPQASTVKVAETVRKRR